jgi:hypothetical protein
MGKKNQEDYKRRTKKNSKKEKEKRNGIYSQKHIRIHEKMDKKTKEKN